MGDQKRHKILMVSDFFYPNFGGVENHIYYLSQCLLKLSHKVVVLTHAYGNRSGVRYMTGGLKVYYIPWKPFLMQNTLPTFYGTLPIMRTILIREKITLVHGHQAFSTLCHEALMHARTMGYKVVFTDHSLYGFADVGSIHMNKVLQFTLADVSQAICVSHTSKENTVLRSGLPPEKVFVIPNAVDTAMFRPAPEKLSQDEIVIVVISRLVYRKGADLLVEVIPEVCRLFPNVRFIVGGDGPKRVRLEEMREKNSLQDRVEMLGAVPHARVQSVLISGHIFLNSSLTEAFCIAILEAASCGLLTVSTRIGGVPEVLPNDMIVLAEPDPSDMVRAITKAISILPKIDPQVMHLRMKKLYSWHDVAKRTEIVYDRALGCPNQNLIDRLSRYLPCGSWADKLFCLVMIIDFLFCRLLQLWQVHAMTSDFKQIMDICDYKESELSSLNGKVTLRERVNEVYKIFVGLRKPGNRSISNIAMNAERRATRGTRAPSADTINILIDGGEKQEHGLGRKSGPLLSGTAYCISSCSMILLNKTLLSSYGFNAGISLTFYQNFISSVVVVLLALCGAVSVERLNWKLIRVWIPVNIIFIGMLVSGMYSLKYINIAMVTIMKNMTNILTATGEYFIFHKLQNQKVWTAMFLMFISAISGGITNLSFHLKGFVWQILNCILTASYSLTLRLVMDKAKQLTRSGSLNEVSMVLLNNLLSLPFSVLLIFLFGEWEYIINVDVVRIPLFWVLATASGLVGLSISFTSMWFLNQTGPTTYSLVGSLNKIPISVAVIVLFNVPPSLPNFFSILFGLFAGVFFVKAKL